MKRVLLLHIILITLGAYSLISFKNVNHIPVSKKECATSVDTFPVPPLSDKTLFYIQRTHNTNTIVYNINTGKDGEIDPSAPVKIFWIRYAEKGDTAELSYIQRHYAYGVESKLMDANKKSYRLNFVSYEKRDIYLMKSSLENKYHAYISINGKLSVLYKIFVKIEGGSFWIPHIKYVEITGKDIANGKTVSERFTP